MRRADLINGLEKVITDLDRSGIANMIRTSLSNADAKESEWFSFSHYNTFTQSTMTYGPIERQIMERLRIDPLLEPRFWQEVMNKSNRDVLIEVYQSMLQTISAVPKIVDLLSRDYDEDAPSLTSVEGSELSGKAVLTIIIPEERGQYSSPERLIVALTSISTFYKFFADLERLDANDLTIVGCDSGSDKSFDFFGLASLIEHVRGLITDIWDRRLLGRQQQMGANIGLLAQSLPVIERLETLAEAGTIGREQCEILKRQLVDGVSKFLDAGVVTNSMVPQGANTPRALMQPQTRLLAAPQVHEKSHETDNKQATTTPADTPPVTQPVLGDLTAEEAATLRRLLDKAEAQATKDEPKSDGSQDAPRARRRRKSTDV